MDKTATTLKGRLEARNPFHGLTFFQQVKDFMRTGYSLALGLALCLTLIAAIGVVYSLYLNAYNKTTTVPRTIKKIRKFLIQYEPLLESASDEDILVETQKLADELVARNKKIAELDSDIRDVTKKLRLDWVSFKGYIYLFEKYAFNWAGAKAFCEKQEATMTCIDSEEEQKFIETETKNANVDSWTGICHKHGWQCYDGSLVVTTYWADKEPIYHGNFCVFIYKECTTENHCWGANYHTLLKRVICRKKPDDKWPE